MAAAVPKAKHAELSMELQRRRESYMRREDALRVQLAEAEAAAAAATSAAAEAASAAAAAAAAGRRSSDGDNGDGTCSPSGRGAGLGSGARGGRGQSVAGAAASAAAAAAAAVAAAVPQGLGGVRDEVVAGVEGLLERQRLALHADGVAQARALRARLAEAEAKLAGGADRAAAPPREGQQHGGGSGGGSGGATGGGANSGSGGGESVAELRAQLAGARGIAERLDRMHALAASEAARLRVEVGAQDGDRERLVRRVLALKRDRYQLGRRLLLLDAQRRAEQLGGSSSSGSGQGQGQPEEGGDELVPRVEATAAAEAAGVRRPELSRPTTADPCRRGSALERCSAAPAAKGRPASAQPASRWQRSGSNYCATVATAPTPEQLLAAEQRRQRALEADCLALRAERAALARFLLDALDAAATRRRRWEQHEQQQQQQQQRHQQQHLGAWAAATATNTAAASGKRGRRQREERAALAAREEALRCVLARVCPGCFDGEGPQRAEAAAADTAADADAGERALAADAALSASSSGASSETDEEPRRQLVANAAAVAAASAAAAAAAPAPRAAAAAHVEALFYPCRAFPSRRPRSAAAPCGWGGRVGAAASMQRPSTACLGAHRSAAGGRLSSSGGGGGRGGGGAVVPPAAGEAVRPRTASCRRAPCVVDIGAAAAQFLTAPAGWPR